MYYVRMGFIAYWSSNKILFCSVHIFSIVITQIKQNALKRSGIGNSLCYNFICNFFEIAFLYKMTWDFVINKLLVMKNKMQSGRCDNPVTGNTSLIR